MLHLLRHLFIVVYHLCNNAKYSIFFKAISKAVGYSVVTQARKRTSELVSHYRSIAMLLIGIFITLIC